MSSARKFSEIAPPLSDTTLEALRTLGFDAMTPVQAATLPLFLGNTDVAVEACTGSGKTIAYVIPVVERLLRLAAPLEYHRVGGVIVSPTRELARQIHSVVNTLIAGTWLRSTLLTGGTEVNAEIDGCLRHGCHIVVATPGRLLDIMRRGSSGIDWRSLEVLVLDEADTLLDMGFADTITQVIAMLPKQRRTGLFSATQTQEVKALARAGMRNPAVIRVAVQHQATASSSTSSAAAAAFSSSSAATRPGSGKAAAKAAPSSGAAAAQRHPPTGNDDDDEELSDVDEMDAEEEEDEEEGFDGELGGGGDHDAEAESQAPAVGSQSTPLTLRNFYRVCESPAAKLELLLAFLRERSAAKDKAIVFVLTCASVDFYGKALSDPALRAAAGLPPVSEFPILPLHGKMVAKKRTGNYEAFVRAASGALLCTDVAARGIDVPDVDWIVQYDPPKDPAFFIHRVGRTARAGRAGAALLLLLPKERDYVPLMQAKRVPLSELGPLAEEREETRGAGKAGKRAAARTPAGAALQQLSLSDRDVLEKGTTAFLSFLRGYREHILKYIFRAETLDISSLAFAFGLVKLPKVDELRAAKDLVYQHAVPGVVTHEIAYADPVREAQRQTRLAGAAEEASAARDARDARRDVAMKKEAAAAAAEAEGAKLKKPQQAHRKHKGVQARMFEDWDQLAREERLEKRLKAGKISHAEYKRELSELNRELGFSDEEDIAGTAALAVAVRNVRAEHRELREQAQKRKELPGQEEGGGSDAGTRVAGSRPAGGSRAGQGVPAASARAAGGDDAGAPPPPKKHKKKKARKSLASVAASS